MIASPGCSTDAAGTQHGAEGQVDEDDPDGGDAGNPPGDGSVGALATLEIMGPATLRAGDELDVTCVGRDARGHVLRLADGQQEVAIKPASAVQAQGDRLTVVEAGELSVTCSVPAAALTSAPAIIAVSAGAPATVGTSVGATDVAAGDTVTASCDVRDAFGNQNVDAVPTLSVQPSDGASVSGLGVTLTKPGSVLVACHVPGAQGTGVMVSVAPGLPAQLKLTVDPSAATYARDSLLTFFTLVQDAYGNEVPDAMVTLSSSPAASVVVSPTKFRFGGEGSYVITGVVAAPTDGGREVSASTSITVSATNQGPDISCDEPLQGSMLDVPMNSVVAFKGTAFDGDGVASLTVNGSAAVVDASGKFTASLTAHFGINHVDIVAVDKTGLSSSRTCAFLASDVWQSESDFPGAISFALFPSAIDDTDRTGAVDSLADLLAQAANASAFKTKLDTSFKAQNPWKPSSCDQEVCPPAGCSCIYRSSISYQSLSLPQASVVSASSVADGISVTTTIATVTLNMKIEGTVNAAPFSQNFTVTYPNLSSTAIYDVKLSAGVPHVTLRAGSQSSSIGNPTVQSNGISPWAVNNVITPFVNAQRANVRTVISNQLVDDQTVILDTVSSSLSVAPLKTDIARLDGSDTFALNLGLSYPSVSATAARARFTLGTRFSAFTAQNRPSLGIVSPPGTTLLDVSVSNPSNVATSLSALMLEQKANALWRAGLYDVVLTGTRIGGGVAANVSAQVSTSLPPVFDVVSASNVALAFGGVTVDLSIPGVWNGTRTIEVVARYTTTPVVAGQTVNVQTPVLAELHYGFGRVQLNAAQKTQLETTLKAVLLKLAQATLAAQPSLPLPHVSVPASLTAYGLSEASFGILTPALTVQSENAVVRGTFGGF
ncbi:MAG: hypothetical protein QM778_00970 [Myxococcales bacterium]